MTQVLLVNPPAHDLEHVGSAFQPVGLRCLERYLSAAGADVALLDAHEAPWSTVEAALRAETPLVVGATVYTHTRAAVHELCRRVRAVAPRARLVLGGHHATFMTRQVLEVMAPDAVVRGEGEAPLLGVVRAAEAGVPLAGLPGVTVLRDGELLEAPAPPPIPVDELPLDGPLFEDRRLTPKEARFMAGDTLGAEPWRHRSFWTTTTRGCPYHCTFCAVLGRSSWRMESPQRVADRLQMLHDEHGCRFLTFGDSSFNVKPDRVIEVCEELVRRKLRIRWFASGMRANAQLVPEAMLEAMARAGCALVCFGVESASPEILRRIKKQLKPDDIDRAVTLAKRHGIHARVSLMVGNPGESDTTIGETLALLDRVKPDLAGLAVAQVYPGTALYDEAKERGFVDDSYWLDGAAPIPFFPGASYADTMRWHALLRFRNVPGRRALARAMAWRASLRQRFGIHLDRHGVRLASPPPLFPRRPDGRAPARDLRAGAPESTWPGNRLARPERGPAAPGATRA